MKMHHRRFIPDPALLPGVIDPGRATLRRKRWQEAADSTGDPAIAASARFLCEDTDGRRLLDGLFDHSSFLTECAIADPAFMQAVLEGGPDDAVSGVMAELAEFRRGGPDLAEIGRILRVAKRRIALATAVADIAQVWPLERVTGALSDFAELALGIGAAHLLRQAALSGAFDLIDPDDPEKGTGLVILGMGKLGARELNYSSDIDLIVLYDPERIRTSAPDALHNHFIRLTRSLVRLMEERTADGYVFRTDLRLRPDPGSTPPAISTLAAEIYYESLGQNWERAAMIKARPVAGDRAAAADCMTWLAPFVWRKHLDFAAIQDIHSIKRQINAQRGGSTIALAGHNVKLGRGGIREVEFFVQTQQLIWGGRVPELRLPTTLGALGALVE